MDVKDFIKIRLVRGVKEEGQMEAALHGPFGRIVLGPGVLTIGRAFDSQLVVNNPTASSHHAEIRPDVYGYNLIDLGSTNGTFVNEQQIDPHLPCLLQGGDRIRIGDMTFLYEAGHPDFQSPFVQESSHKDVPTAKVKAFSPSEQFGYQPLAPYSFATPLQPVPPAFTPIFEQSNTPTLAMDSTNGIGIPVPPLPYVSPSMQSPPVPPKSSRRLKVLLIGLSIVLVLAAGGGGITAYMLTRPQPVMTVTSDYRVGSTPAGSTGTVLHVSAHSFSGSSAITFMLDNLPVASNHALSSDTDGNVKADLMITSTWAVGNHMLTAKDASGYTTKAGVPVVIVPQGQAHTPGPNGAPPDDMSFTLYASVQEQDAGTGKQLGSYSQTLMVTGKPDPSGGTVCQYFDHGQQNTNLGNSGNGITYRETSVFSCSGTYKGGKLSYIETATSSKIYYSNGQYCVARTPFVNEDLEGTFTSQYTISGTLSSDSITWDCSGGGGTQLANASKGSWTAQL